MKRIVVVGGVAAGMSAAAQARRRLPEAEVVLLERGEHISYGACGMPYNMLDPGREMEDLVVVSPEEARGKRRIDLRLGTTVTAIEPARRVVAFEPTRGGRREELSYDALVIATGASAVLPPISGIEHRGVFKLRGLQDGAVLKHYLEGVGPRRAVIIGAGYIGMEMAEVLTERGVAVTVLEMQRQVLPGYERTIAEVALAKLAERGVVVRTGTRVKEVTRGRRSELSVVVDGDRVDTDLVLVATGIRPNVELAREAGIALGDSGAISVDAYQQTSVPGVYAAGDCAEAFHLVMRRPAWVPLGTTANKQGRVAGANAAGAQERFAGIVGTAAFKLFDLEVGRTGLSRADAEQLQIPVGTTSSRHANRGHGYPGRGTITTHLVVQPNTGMLLGAQMAGPGAVAARLNVFAAALHAGMTIFELSELDLAYAPPFAPVHDPILIAASVAAKELRDR